MSARVIASGLTADRTFAFPDANGTIVVTGSSPSFTIVQVGDGTVGAPSLAFTSAPTTGLYTNGGNQISFAESGVNVLTVAAAGEVRTGSGGSFAFSTNTAPSTGSADLILARDAANILAQKNGTNAQAFRVYGNASTVKYALLSHDGSDGNISAVGTSSNLTIAAPSALFFQPGNANTWQMAVSGTLLGKIPTGGLGYATGAGGAVTQLTSRATGVTLNTVTGDITLFSAAGSATAASFTVTNSAVAATDNIIINQKSGTNLYNTIVTTVGAGSFVVTFYTTGGTATDAPVFHFSVIKGVNA